MPRRRRRFGRITLNVLTVLSLLLCVGTVGLWVRSHWRMDAFYYTSVHTAQGRFGQWALWTSNHHFGAARTVYVGRYAEYHAGLLGLEGGLRHFRGTAEGFAEPTWPDPPTARLGPQFVRSNFSTPPDFYVYDAIEVPYWLVVTAAAPLPLIRAYALARGKRVRPAGLCAHCRYDLTGNASGVCPECGTPVAAGVEDAAGPAVTPAAGPAPKPDA